ncbi:MAG: tail fiber protein [Bacteroidota bacterium]
MRHLIYLVLSLLLTIHLSAQVGINTDNSDPDASAMLDVKSTNRGMLVPRMTSSQRTMISNAAIGLLVFDTTTESFWFRDSNGWVELVAGGGALAHDDANNLVKPNTSSVDVSTDDFVFGSTQLDHSYNVDHYSRFFFDKSKGAFRAGIEEGDKWDDANRGIGSIALGNSSTAAGENSVAMGYQNSALGNATVTIGNHNVVNTDTAFAIGGFNSADKDYALAIGIENKAQEEASTAIGFANLATAAGASAFGEYNEANGVSSLALGSGAIANGLTSVAIGSSNAEGTGSLAIGISNIASGDFSQAFGSLTTAPSYNEAVFGYLNTNYTPASTSSASLTDRLFVVGNGNVIQRSDALIILKNGATRINGPLTLGISGNDMTNYTLPNFRGSNGQILQTNGSGVVNWADAPASSSIRNGSGTTKVDASSNSEISFEAGGQQILTMQRGNFEFYNTNGSIYLGGDAGKSDNYSGFNNIGIGSNALSLNSRGSNNTAIGNSANVDSDNLSNATAIGAGAIVNQSNALVLGNNANVGIGTSTPNEKLHVVGNVKIEDGNAQAGYILTSDANGVGTWQQNTGANGIQNVIQDGDADTKIQVERSNDEDIINFSLGGPLTFRMVDSRLEFIDPLTSIYIGYNAGINRDAVKSLYNVMLGHEAGMSITEGSSNVGLGTFSLNSNQTGGFNTALGAFAARLNTSGDNNVAVGTRASFDNETGNNNVAVGTDAGQHSTGNNNIFLGYQAGQNETGDNKLYIENSSSNTPLIYGDFSADSVSINGDLTISSEYLSFNNIYDNIFIGDGAGFNNMGGGNVNVDGIDNVFIGDSTGFNNTTGQFNVGLATKALFNNTTGEYNVGIGPFALLKNTEGIDNVAVGMHSLSSNVDGQANTAMGFRAGGVNESGNANVFIGGATGGGLNPVTPVDMEHNVMLGFAAGGNNNGSNNVFIGHKAGMDETGNHKLYVDNSETTTPLLYGEFDNDLVRVNGELNIKNEYSLPATDGTSGQVLTTDGAGNTAWSDRVSIPIGTIWMYHGDTAPDGWLICDGSDFSVSEYNDLRTLLGGNTLPDFRARFPMGTGDNGNLGSPDARLGNKGGSNSHQLDLDEMPPHTHSISYRVGSENGSSSNNYSDLGNTGTTSQTGSTGGNNATDEATPFNITNPYYVVNFIIKAK